MTSDGPHGNGLGGLSTRRSTRIAQTIRDQPETQATHIEETQQGTSSGVKNTSHNDSLGTSPLVEGKRRSTRAASTPYPSQEEVEDYVSKPITQAERHSWKGWCEIESDPAFFNVMLRDFGVQGVKVQEVFSLDETMVNAMPKPVYGFIFLFQFVVDNVENQEPSCPEHVWFANQTINNACATIALLNIVMNARDVEIGDSLQALRDFTKDMTPALRGTTVGTHEYIRQVHNSFTRRMDLLNVDLALSNDFADRNVKKRKVSSRKKNSTHEDPNGFHFVAFVPIEDCVWKLDGLDRQPTNLGEFNGDWMEIIRPHIQERMLQQEGDDALAFTLLSVCRSPLLSVPEKLAASINTLIAIETDLDKFGPAWRSFVDVDAEGHVLRGPDVGFGVSQVLLDSNKATWNPADWPNGGHSVENLMKLRSETVENQALMRAEMLEEVAAVAQDDTRAQSRRNDYTPMIQAWLQALADNGILQGLAVQAG